MAKHSIGVGVGVMILNNQNQILLGKRSKNEKDASSKLRGAGHWTMPGGKMDFGEKMYNAAIRETKEETDLDIEKLEIIALNEDMLEDVHFVTIGFLATKWTGEVKVMEPEQITEWRWFALDELPEPMYFPSKKVLNNFKQKEIFVHNNK